MTDLATAEPLALSTTLDTNVGTGAAGAGEPRTLADDKPEPASLRDTIADAVKEGNNPADETDDAKPANPEDGKGKDEAAKSDGKDKPEVSDKAKPDELKPTKDRAEDGKFAAKADSEGEGDEANTDDSKDDKAGHYQPPKALLPDAREKWVNVPRTVQRDIDNMARQHEAEVTQLRQATERYEPLREYDDLVRQNGRAGLHETLAEVKQLEDMMESNPVAALNQVLQRAGPRKPDGQPFSLYEVATAIAQQGPEGYQRMVAQRPATEAQPQANPEVAQLKQQIAQMQVQQVASTVIEPFKAAHPRYDELKGTIAQFLKTDMIPTSLSASDRLEAAYNMAERLSPPSNVEASQSGTRPDPDRRADASLSGSKSIKSAPGSVSPDLEPDRGGSIRDLLSDEIRRNKRA